MKITITEIEATAEELRASNSLGDVFSNLLRNVFYKCSGYSEYNNQEEEAEE